MACLSSASALYTSTLTSRQSSEVIAQPIDPLNERVRKAMEFANYALEFAKKTLAEEDNTFKVRRQLRQVSHRLSHTQDFLLRELHQHISLKSHPLLKITIKKIFEIVEKNGTFAAVKTSLLNRLYRDFNLAFESSTLPSIIKPLYDKYLDVTQFKNEIDIQHKEYLCEKQNSVVNTFLVFCRKLIADLKDGVESRRYLEDYKQIIQLLNEMFISSHSLKTINYTLSKEQYIVVLETLTDLARVDLRNGGNQELRNAIYQFASYSWLPIGINIPQSIQELIISYCADDQDPVFQLRRSLQKLTNPYQQEGHFYLG